jgi:hypothetical protein
VLHPEAAAHGHGDFEAMALIGKIESQTFSMTSSVMPVPLSPT